MKLNIYKTQTEIEKTYEVDAYDLMYGIVEDVLNVIEEAGHGKDNLRLAQVIAENRYKFNDLLKDIFPEMTDDELRRTKIKELAQFFIELFNYVKNSFVNSKNQ